MDLFFFFFENLRASTINTSCTHTNVIFVEMDNLWKVLTLLTRIFFSFSIYFKLPFFPFIFIRWRLITLQYRTGFCHTLTRINHGFNVFPIPIPPPTSLSTRSLWDFPVHQVRALASCIQPGLVIYFTLDNIHVSMLFSWIIPPSSSPTSPKFCSVHLCLFFCFAYKVIITIFLNSKYMC